MQLLTSESPSKPVAPLFSKYSSKFLVQSNTLYALFNLELVRPMLTASTLLSIVSVSNDIMSESRMICILNFEL